MPSVVRSHALAGLFVALGLALRLALLPLPGTLDVRVWKIWAFTASTSPVAYAYADPRHPSERRRLRFGNEYTAVDYPPLAVHVLGMAGRLYRAVRPSFADGPALTVAVKLPTVLADVALAWALWSFARKRGGEPLRVLFHWWLGPAVLLNGAALGYLDPLAALPLALAFMAAASERWPLAGALGAVAVLMKAQAAVPLIALAWGSLLAGRRAAARAGAAAAVVTAAVVAPIVMRGAGPALLKALLSLTRHDMVSGYATNAWWIFTWLYRASYAATEQGAWVALTNPVRILALSTVEELGHGRLRPIGSTLVATGVLWATWRATRWARQARGPSLPATTPSWAMGAALGAFLVHVYYSLGVQVHENHLFLAIPLALIAGVALPSYRRVTVALGAIQALNLFLFYGISDRIGWLPPRGITVIDATVVLAFASVAVFAWHARVFVRLTRLDETSGSDARQGPDGR